MMEFEYSPRHSPTASPHLLSPTHAHHPAVEGFTVRQIRRSLSRSPSKPQRYTLFTAKSPKTSPAAHIPSLDRSYQQLAPPSTEPIPKPHKYSVKRTASTRLASRRSSPNSPPRRALSDNNTQANAAPKPARRVTDGDGQENQDMSTTAGSHSQTSPEPICDDPIKIDFLKPDRLLQPVLKEHASPAKSSPLKRSDGVMNLDAANFGSPRNKRRSLHGASFGSDFNIFDQCPDQSQHESIDGVEEKERDRSSATLSANSPQRRPFSLRKSTLQQRTAPGRSRLFQDIPRDAAMSPSLTRARSRISLDSALPLRSLDVDSPFRRGSANDPPVLFAPNAQKPYQSAPKPHPLSYALTPTSSMSSMGEDAQMQLSNAPTLPQPNPPQQPFFSFSKSLPVGAFRPDDQLDESNSGSDGSFATPATYKMAKPHPQAFMSTGLISKRNRNVDMGPADFANPHMPDTPSKKFAHVQLPSPPRPPSALGHVAQPIHEFGSPTTPFNGRVTKTSTGTFGNGLNVFGTGVGAPQLTRRGSFLGFDADDNSNSPDQDMEGRAMSEEMPPTPTKSASITIARPQSKGGKSNSLRSSLFGRRTSLGPETFASPAVDDDAEPEREYSFGRAGKVDAETSSAAVDTATMAQDVQERRPPHTPQVSQESFTPPDPSNLSISVNFGTSTTFRNSHSFPPATPTGPRDSFATSHGQSLASSSYFNNDVDTSLTARFAQVSTSGIGEFSQVYRVEKPHTTGSSAMLIKPASVGNVWAVKKSRRPYTGNKDRQRKMREVQILRALRGHDHIVEFVDDWESKGHLYIQTEFCENGNLKDFLTSTGFKGRLDDFRIWKILLELGQGVKAIHDSNFIHLDLKPANVFIDWEGVLKIGDFGMASQWPAPPGLDGEGDREYIGPEVLSGRFDKAADIFALGMIMLEIAGNIVLPDNGTSWQRLRAGDLSDLPSLTWSSASSLTRDESGDPIEMMHGASNESLCVSVQGEDDLSFLKPSMAQMNRTQELVQPPNFMVDANDAQALESMVQWMISPNPDLRPTAESVLCAGGVQWVEKRRRAGATVYEGNWGPADEVLNHEEQHDVEMVDI